MMARIPFLEFLQEGYLRFGIDPLRFLIATLLVLLASCTGILTGVGIRLYLAYLHPNRPQDPIQAKVWLMQILSSSRAGQTAFWFGLLLTVCIVFLPLTFAFVVIPITWFAILLSSHFDLTPGVTLRAMGYFCRSAPKQAFGFLVLIALALSGVIFFGVGILLTLPIATFASLRYLTHCQRDLAAAIQQAY